MRAYISPPSSNNPTSSVITGAVEYFADLPTPVLGLAGKAYLVTKSQGVWFINRKPAGIYICDGLAWYLAPDLDFLINASFNTLTIGQPLTSGSFKFEIKPDGDLALYYYDGANWTIRETFTKG